MRMFSSFWSGSEEKKWCGYKATCVMVFTGISKALLDNYWVMTEVPLAGNVPDPAAKTFYMLGQILVNAVVAGGIGLVLDYERGRNYSERESEARNLLAPGQL